MPIRLRLTLFSAVGALLLSIAGGFAFVHSFSGSLHRSGDVALRTTADAIVQDLSASAGHGDLNDPVPTGLLNQRQGVTQIIDPNGRVSDASDDAGSASLIDARTLRRARAHTVTIETYSPVLHEQLRVLATPIGRADGKWVVVSGASLAAVDDAVDRVEFGLALGVALMVLCAASGAWLLSTLALRPVERMRRQAMRLSASSQSAQLDVPGTHDEIARLAETMNDLLRRLADSLAQQRAFVADAGHELRTPLTILQAELELAEGPGGTAEDLRQAITNARNDAVRLTNLAEQLLFLASHDERGAARARDPQPLRPPLDRSAERARRLGALRNVDIAIDASPDLVAAIVAEDIERAVDNMLTNAVRHSAPHTTVQLRAQRTGDGNMLQLTVSDHGPGFPPAFLPHAFERFRRADAGRASAEGGSGLGLAIVAAVADEHGGAAWVGNEEAGGAVVGITIPTGFDERGANEPTHGERPTRR